MHANCVVRDIAIILAEIAKQDYSTETVRNLMAKLAEKKINFTFNATELKELFK